MGVHEDAETLPGTTEINNQKKKPLPCRVFVLADPDVFSGPVGQVLSSDIETCSSGDPLEPLDHMRRAVQHVLQAVLGPEQCHGKKLAKALRVSGIAFFFFSIPGWWWWWGGVSRGPCCVEVSECSACSSIP